MKKINLILAGALIATSVSMVQAKEISTKYSFESEIKNGKDVLFLVNKKTNKKTKVLSREYISGGGFGCSFENIAEVDKQGNLYATYDCQISQQFQEDILENNAIYKISTKGKLLKKINNAPKY